MRIITEVKEILYQKGLSLKFVAEELSKQTTKRNYYLPGNETNRRNHTLQS